MVAIINTYNAVPYIIIKKSKNEKVNDDGLLVSWISLFWNIEENKFVSNNSSISLIHGKSKANSILKIIINEYKSLRPLTKVVEIDTMLYEGYEFDDKIVQWRIEHPTKPTPRIPIVDNSINGNFRSGPIYMSDNTVKNTEELFEENLFDLD